MATSRTKVAARSKKSDQMVDRNLELTERFMHYVFAKPEILDTLPDNFELIILPANDPELRQFNLDLLDEQGSENRPIVFVRLGSGNKMDFKTDQPQVYAPVAI